MPGRPTHPRITYLTGPPHKPDTAEAVRALIGDDAHGLVILGSRAPISETVAEFHLYSPLVPVGSYVIMEETIVNGHPVWPNFGAGPWEAVEQLTRRRLRVRRLAGALRAHLQPARVPQARASSRLTPGQNTTRPLWPGWLHGAKNQASTLKRSWSIWSCW